MADHAASPPVLSRPEPDKTSLGSPQGTIPTWRWALSNFGEIVTAILLAVMIGSIGTSVFCRYMLKLPLSWTEEVVLICMVWTCFLGSSVAAKHNEHIFIDFVVALVPRGLARAMDLLSLVTTKIYEKYDSIWTNALREKIQNYKA